MDTDCNYDLIILGGGCAGLTAAIYAARARLRVILLEREVTGGLVNATYVVENFPGFFHIHGRELMDKMRAHVDELGVPVEEWSEIERLELTGPRKTVVTADGAYTARAIILATGRSPVMLDTPTSSEEVHYCAICDGSPYVGKRVLVVGGGNSAFDESLYLLGLGVAHITLVESADQFFAARVTQETLLNHPTVEARVDTRVIDLIRRNGRLAATVLENTRSRTTEEIPVDGIFVFLGQRPNNVGFVDQIELTPQGYICAGMDMSTSLPGVFSAGDINDKAFRQITTAMADGTVAALAAEKYLRAGP